jgi:hypothetical protein
MIVVPIVALFAKPIPQEELERGNMRSLSWPCEDPEEFLALMELNPYERSRRPSCRRKLKP